MSGWLSLLCAAVLIGVVFVGAAVACFIMELERGERR